MELVFVFFWWDSLGNNVKESDGGLWVFNLIFYRENLKINKEKIGWGREEEKGRCNGIVKVSIIVKEERWVVLEFWIWDLEKFIKVWKVLVIVILLFEFCF